MESLRSIHWAPALVSGILLLASFRADVQGAGQSTQTKPTLQGAKNKSAASAKPAANEPPSLEPKAIEILRTASSRLAAANTMSFTAVESFESLSRQNAPLVFTNKFNVTLQRPNKLRVIQSADGPASEFYYDGKITTAFAPAENLVAIADAPPTIDATLEAVYHSAAIYFPFTDLIVANPYGDLAPGLQHAYYVGQSKVVGDTTTDVVAYAGDGVFAQVWIGTEDKLPRLIHVVYVNDPEQLRHNLLFADWQLDVPIPADVFMLSGAANAKHIQFAHPHPESTPGAVPPTKAKAAKSQ